MPPKIAGLALAGIILLAAGNSAEAQSQPLSLQQMTAAAGFIFSGKVIDVRSERDALTGFIVTCSTVAVQDAVRGVNTARFTFKQYGGSYHGMNVFVADMSYCTVGEEIVAFLYPASALGLTSPVGMSAGKLAVQRDPATGKKFVIGHVFQAKPLQSGVETSTTSLKAAPLMEYDRFIKLVREIAADNQQP